MLKSKKIIGTCALLLTTAITCRATGYEGLLKKMEQHNKLTEVSYTYSVTLKDLQSGKMLDSVRGKMYASGLRYLDSNARSLSIRNDQYFCKLYFTDKTAEVYNNEQIRIMLGGKMPDKPQDLFALSQEVFKEYSRIIVDSTSDRKHYRIRVLLKIREMPEVSLVIRKTDYLLTEMRIELADEGDEQYRRSIHLYDIQRRVNPEIFRPDRIFTATGNKIKLQGKYATYKLLSTAR